MSGGLVNAARTRLGLAYLSTGASISLEKILMILSLTSLGRFGRWLRFQLDMVLEVMYRGCHPSQQLVESMILDSMRL